MGLFPFLLQKTITASERNVELSQLAAILPLIKKIFQKREVRRLPAAIPLTLSPAWQYDPRVLSAPVEWSQA
jgi:hypothetical protein